MNIDVNTPLDELLETWAMYSRKLIYTMLDDKEELDHFNKVKLVLKTKGIMKLDIQNVYDNEYVLHYTKQGGIFEKRIIFND